MPPDSTHIDQEGISLDNFCLVERGRFRDKEIRQALGSGPYPARNIDNNIADLKAQIAANEKGIAELRRMIQHFGLDVVQAYMSHIQRNTEEHVRQVISTLQNGRFEYGADNGAIVRVEVKVDPKERRAIVDFTGTSGQMNNNFNAPPSISRAAVLYVFRTLVGDDIPMNEGCLAPIELVLPEGSLVNPHPPAAVVAGNVETSQIVTDALYGALGVQAGSQGTMNNFTFGTEAYQYYETICGGHGAGPTYNGTDAVHTHMTNSRLTDPEILELRFPVEIVEFSIRHGSGGEGKHVGGAGVRRRIKFNEAMSISMLANRRKVPPFGLQGGGPGGLGANWLDRENGERIVLGSADKAEVEPGDIFTIETPGGGGFGKKSD